MQVSPVLKTKVEHQARKLTVHIRGVGGATAVWTGVLELISPEQQPNPLTTALNRNLEWNLAATCCQLQVHVAARIRVNGCAHTVLTAGELQRDEHPVCLSENEGMYAPFFLDNKRHMVGRFFITCSGRLLDSCCYDQKQHAHYLHDVCIQIICATTLLSIWC